MKYLLTFLITLNLYAFWGYQDPTTIENWNNSIELDQEELIDLIYSETAGEYFAGDDGEECEGWIDEFTLTKSDADSFTISYEPYLEQAHHCLHSYDMFCDAVFTKREEPSKYYPHNWDYEISCSFDF